MDGMSDTVLEAEGRTLCVQSRREEANIFVVEMEAVSRDTWKRVSSLELCGENGRYRVQ